MARRAEARKWRASPTRHSAHRRVRDRHNGLMSSVFRSLCPLAAIACLVACDPPSSPASYPRDWPTPQPGPQQGVACADLSGRYAIGEGVLGHVFPRPSGPQDHGIHWHTLQIAADGSGRLALTFFGNGIDDEVGAPPQTRTQTLDGSRCVDGWIRRGLGRNQGTPIERAEGDTRSVERYLLIARDRGGNLVAQEVVERYESVSFWAPGGADVRVPFTGSTDRLWSRWLAASDDPLRPRVNPLARDDTPVLRTLGRRLPPDVEVLSRRADGDGHVLELKLADASQLTLLEERLLSSAEFGEARILDSQRRPGGGIVATVRIGPPLPRADESARLAAANAQRAQTEAVVKRVLPLLRPCTSVNDAQAQDDGYLIEVRCPDAEALSVFIGHLRESPSFGIPEVRRTEPYIRSQVTASVWVRAR
jgi:hypothetical protein